MDPTPPGDLPPRPAPAAELREQHPAGESWRADALGRSRHSRLDAGIVGENFDEERAAALCAEVTRNLLGDFAPALLLLPGAERRRVQALVAYAHTLFDFARQRGVEGERLAQINRWEFTLEDALSGRPVGQPIFVRMARENERRPWPADALDELAACARRRATRPRPASAAEAEADARALGRALGAALLEKRWNAEVNGLAAALVRLHALQHLGPEIAGRRSPFAASEVGEDADGRPDPEALLAAMRRECSRLRPRLLRAPRGLPELPAGYRRAAVFSLLAGLRLLAVIEDAESDLLATPPRLGLAARLGLLARAWSSRLG
jgi:phytoene/squalene synthetase